MLEYKQIVVVYLPTYISLHRTRVEFSVAANRTKPDWTQKFI